MIPFICPATGEPLRRQGDQLLSGSGASYPIVNGIPRFVSGANYADAFGLEWSVHTKTQLDSVTGASISRVRLERCLGAGLGTLAGKTVCETGCGAGRFTELLVGAGALVHSIDLSVAVDANRRNIGDRPNYVVAQADVRKPPFADGSFDVVMALGMVQHTPSPEETIRKLYALLKPGGLLLLDHYTWDLSSVTKLAPLYRLALKRMSAARSKRVTDGLVRFFFPLHWAVRNLRPAQMILSRVSPSLVYFRSFPELSKEQHYEWCRLDTYDHLTDHYKHFRTRGQIQRTLSRLGAERITVWLGGNGVEARCEKPRA